MLAHVAMRSVGETVYGCVAERRSCHGGMMTAAGWVVAVDKLIETGQIQITNCDANFAVGMTISGFSTAVVNLFLTFSLLKSA